MDPSQSSPDISHSFHTGSASRSLPRGQEAGELSGGGHVISPADTRHSPSLARLKLLRLLSLLKPAGGRSWSGRPAWHDLSTVSVSSSFSLMTPNSPCDDTNYRWQSWCWSPCWRSCCPSCMSCRWGHSLWCRRAAVPPCWPSSPDWALREGITTPHTLRHSPSLSVTSCGSPGKQSDNSFYLHITSNVCGIYLYVKMMESYF